MAVGEVEVMENVTDQNTGGYVIAGKPYIIGDGDGDWGASMMPKQKMPGIKIEVHPTSQKEEELCEIARQQILALIRKAEAEQR